MASERYSRVGRMPNKLYSAGCPVIVEAGSLLFDRVKNQTLAQLKFSSFCREKIKAVIVVLTFFDVAQNMLGSNEFQYLDWSIATYQTFGDKTAVPVPDNRACSFTVIVRSVVFADDTVWNNIDGKESIPLPEGEKLPFQGELLQQYQRELSPKLRCSVAEYRHMWQCGCGAWNLVKDEICHDCRISRQKQKQMANEQVLLPLLRQYQEEAQKRERQQRERERLKTAARDKRKKVGIFIAALAAAVWVAVLVIGKVVIPSQKYGKAEQMLSQGNYKEAASAFAELGDFQDAAERGRKLYYIQAELLLTDGEYAAASECFFKAAGYHDALKRGWIIQYAYLNNGTIAAGWDQTVGLRTDGTVIAVGDNDGGQINIRYWTDIIAIDAGGSHTVGLKADGTVIASGKSNVKQWTDIVAIAVYGSTVLGLKSDGTVIAVGYGDYNVSDWTDIVAIDVGWNHIIGLKSDGKVVAVEPGRRGKTKLYGYGWTDIVAIAAGDSYTVGLKADGTVIGVGSNSSGQINVRYWTDIIAIDAAGAHTVGLKSDGTVIAVGSNDAGQSNVSDWTDIVAIACSSSHTIGLKADGTVVAVGRNEKGQIDIEGWGNIGSSLTLE